MKCGQLVRTERMFGGLLGKLCVKIDKKTKNGDVAPFCDGCHTGTNCCPERLKLVWSLDKMYIETE